MTQKRKAVAVIATGKPDDAYGMVGLTKGKMYKVVDGGGGYHVRFTDDLGGMRAVHIASPMITIAYVDAVEPVFDPALVEVMQHPASVSISYDGQKIGWLSGDGFTIPARAYALDGLPPSMLVKSNTGKEVRSMVRVVAQ